MTKKKESPKINLQPPTGQKQVPATICEEFLDDACNRVLIFSDGSTVLADLYSGMWRGNVDLGKYNLNILK